MSDENAKNNFENIYLFLGLDDFESDKKRIAQAFENLETVYGVKLDKLITKNAPIDVPPHIKENFADWGEEETRSFIADLANKASIYRLVLNDPKKLAVYDEQLRAQPTLLQGQDNKKSNDQLVGRQFAPDGEENALAAYYQHLEEQMSATKNFEIIEGGDPRKIQQLLNRFMVTYHKYSWDLKNKPQDVGVDLSQEDAEIKDVRIVENDVPREDNAEVAQSDAPQSVEGEYLEAPAKQEEQKRIGHTVDGESQRVDDFDMDAEEDDEDNDLDADFDENPPQDSVPIKSEVNDSFTKVAREQAIYPPDGERSPAFGLPMVLDCAYSDYGNMDLHVLSGIEGHRRSFTGKNGFNIEGQLKVNSYVLNHPDKQPDQVAISGTLALKCNGAFINGQVDGRVRQTKAVEGVVQGQDVRPVRTQLEEHSYKKGKVEIDAGHEDVVVNGDMLGKVIIKTTGNVRVVGNISDKVEIHAGGNIDILGSVEGNARILAHGQVGIRGKKAWSVKTSANVSVGNSVIPSAQLEAIRARIAAQECAESTIAQDKTVKKDAPAFL